MWLATGFGVGRVRWAPGTAGSVLGLFMWWPVSLAGPLFYGVLLAVALGVGIVATGRAAEHLGQRDPAMVVWDEVAGMGVALFDVPHRPLLWGAAFVLFRVFDITKPPPVAGLERLPGGYGIMLDDIAAGLYAAFVLWVGIWVATTIRP